MGLGIMSPPEVWLVLAPPPAALPSVLFSFLGKCSLSRATWPLPL